MGYTPDIALDSDINHLIMAIDGKMEFLRKTNPFRPKEDIEEEKEDEALKERGMPAQAALGLLAWAQRSITKK